MAERSSSRKVQRTGARMHGPAAIPVLLAPRQATVPEIGLQTAREDAATEPQGHRRREYRPPQSSRRCIERITRAPGGPGRQSPERLAALLSSALDGFLTAQQFLPEPDGPYSAPAGRPHGCVRLPASCDSLPCHRPRRRGAAPL